MKFKKLKSFAKINLSLNVIKKLPNKYHSIESLVSFVEIFDEIKSVNGHTVHSRSRTKHQKKIKEHSVTQFVAIRTDKLNPTYLDRYFTAGQSQHRIAIMHGIEGLDTVSLK